MVLSTTLLIATFSSAICLPLVQTTPTEFKPPTFVFGTDSADNSFVLTTDPLTEGLTSRTLLNAHGFPEIVLRYFRLKFLLLLSSENTETTNLNVAPLLVAAHLVHVVDVRAKKNELACRQQALAVGSEGLGRDGMTTRHFSSLPLRIIIPSDHVRLICEVCKFIQLLREQRFP